MSAPRSGSSAASGPRDDTPRIVAYIALGSNLGDRAATLFAALADLDATPAIDVARVSQLIETAPMGPPGQGPYLNAAAELRTTLGPRELLETLLAIEARHGRDRASGLRNAPRTLDLDLLFHGVAVVSEPGLVVPHPRLHERRFVLEPLAELAPDLVHPVRGESVRSLLASLAAGDDARSGGEPADTRTETAPTE